MPVLDVSVPLSESHPLSIRSGREVAVPESIGHGRAFIAERAQLLGEPEQLSLVLGAGVIGDKSRDPLLPLLADQESPIERLQARPVQRGSIADIVQPRGGHEHGSIRLAHDAARVIRQPRDRLHVAPPIGHRAEQALSLALGPTVDRHRGRR